jgi:hypothetical protein
MMIMDRKRKPIHNLVCTNKKIDISFTAILDLSDETEQNL